MATPAQPTVPISGHQGVPYSLQTHLKKSQLPLTFQSLLNIYPIRERVMSFLDTKDILRLRQTSWSIRQDIIANEWNINTKLERFIKHPVGFRSQLGKSDALISGSFALQFLERVVWPESDLDIMVQDGENLEGLARFLTETEGYEMTLSKGLSDEDGYDPGSITDVMKCRTYFYCKRNSNTFNDFKNSKSKIQLVATSGPPLQAILRGYYTTAIVNFISWNKAYSVFPRATFIDHQTVPLKHIDEHKGELHQKYSRRGWRMRTEPVVPKGILGRGGFTFPLGKLDKDGTRRVGDHDTWTLPLDTTSVEKPAKPDFVLEYSCFQVKDYRFHGVDEKDRLSWDRGDIEWSFRLWISANPFRSHSLKYTYTCHFRVVKHGSELFSVWDELGRKLDNNTMGQLIMKMERSTVDEVLKKQMPTEPFKLKFEHPDGWDYYDNDIPKLIDEMEKKGLV
ncbi:hypothetical protein F4779DRAFT_614462 [Xylariaceae sp. FL0662B]|nr:hypothetical protein F4779DRAFT_614462 [Xylariaceae sp. FL0662B]